MKKFIIIIFIIGFFGLFTTNATFISSVLAMLDEKETQGEEGEAVYQDIAEPSNESGHLSQMPGIPGANPQKPQTPEYAPGQLIVKLKQDKTLEDIRELNTKYNVTDIEKVFKDISSPEDKLKELKTKLSESSAKHDSWYWQLDKDSKEYKDYIAKLEKEKQGLHEQIKAQEELIAKLAERQKRAPEGAVTPNLENIYLLKTGQDINIPAMAQDYSSNPSVEYAEPNYIAKVQMVPNDPLYPQQWAHQRTQAEVAWDVETGDPSIVTAIVDTGVDYNHEDLAANIWRDTQDKPGKDFVDIDTAAYTRGGYQLISGEDYTNRDSSGNLIDDYEPLDYYGHGTHVAGIVGAVANNNKGVAGVCHNCKIMPVRAGFAIRYESNTYGALENDDIANAITYAVNNGADIINMSFGSNAYAYIVKDAIDYAALNNIVLVASAGNSNSKNRSYPAAFDNVIAVASTASDDSKAYYSNYGDWVDITAPGGDSSKDTMILSTVPMVGHLSDPSGYKALQGTSMAAPYASGLAALLIAHRPELFDDPEEYDAMRKVLQASCDDISPAGFDIYTAYGRINANKALDVQAVLRVKINTPSSGSVFALQDRQITITGIASGPASSPYFYFRDYQLFYRKTVGSNEWIPIAQAISTPIENGVLGTWIINDLPTDLYDLKLVATTSDGKFRFEDVIQTIIEEPAQQITTNNRNQWLPQISGDLIVWMDNRNGASDIYLYDLADSNPTTAERRITTESAEQNYPAISGNRIVWTDYRNKYPGTNFFQADIYMCTYDPTTGSCPQQQITTNPYDQWSYRQSISGDRIVWEDHDHGTAVYLYNLNNPQENRTLGSDGRGFKAAISGNLVVFEWGDLFLYDLAREKTHQLTNGLAGMYFLPASISDNRIVWSDYGNYGYGQLSRGDIYLCTYDPDNPSDPCPQIQITNRPGDIERNPYISGNRIAWMDSRNGNWDIFYCKYDPLTGAYSEKRITSHPQFQGYPVISGTRIVWTDYRNGNYDIYMLDISKSFNLEPPEAPGNLAATVVSEDQINLSWQDQHNSGNEIGFKIERSLDGSSFEPIVTVDTDIITYNDQGLIPGTRYYYRIYAYNNAGNSAYSNTATIQTPADTTPPISVSITSPQHGDIVSGNITITADASDNVGVVGVWFKLDGNNLGEEDTSAPYSISWDTTTAAAGQHTLTAVARDAAGNTTESTAVTVFVNRAPILNVIGNKTVNEGQVLSFAISATDPDGDTLTYSASGLPSGASFDPDAVSFTWTPTYDQAGNYPNVRFTVSDGTLSDSEEITITVNNVDITPPTGTITINDGATYTNSTSVTLNLSATDSGSGVSQIQFSNDNSNWSIPEDYADTRIDWDLNDIRDGQKTVYVKFKDAAGNWSQAFSDTIILDVTLPTLQIIFPKPNSSVSGKINLKASAWDNIAVTNVEFYRDNNIKLGEDTASPYQIKWDTATVTKGYHIIFAKAYDAAGNVRTSAKVKVRVRARP